MTDSYGILENFKMNSIPILEKLSGSWRIMDIVILATQEFKLKEEKPVLNWKPRVVISFSS